MVTAKGMPPASWDERVSGPRPKHRDDDVPTRIDTEWWSTAERAIASAVRAVEEAGASEDLTRAVTLLGKAQAAVADHYERSVATDGDSDG